MSYELTVGYTKITKTLRFRNAATVRPKSRSISELNF